MPRAKNMVISSKAMTKAEKPFPKMLPKMVSLALFRVLVK